MLVQKLLRLEDTLIQEVETLAQEMSKTEYTSFSSLVRQLIRKGLDTMENNTTEQKEQSSSFIETVKKISSTLPNDVNRLLAHIKEHRITKSAREGATLIIYNMEDFMDDIDSALWHKNDIINTDIRYFLKLYNQVMVELQHEGFQIHIQTNFSTLSATINWREYNF